MDSWLYLTAVAIAILVNKSIKLIIALLHHEKFSIKIFTRSGDMPSDHSAVVAAVTVSVGRLNGLSSAVFAISFCFAVLVIYDAMHLRLSSGEQGMALNKLLVKNNQKSVKVSMGHEPAEVYMGVAVGCFAAFASFLLF